MKNGEKRFSRSFYCFIESFTYSLLVYYVFYVLSPFKYEFLEMNLHPLVVVVALIAIKYGTHLSIFGVCFAIAFYFLAYLNLGRDVIIFFATFEYYKFILMFFFTALFIGKLKDSTEEQVIHLENELKRFKKGFRRQKQNNIKLTFVNSRLKNQIVNSKESILTLHKVTSSLDRMEVEGIFTETLLNIKQFINCDVISIYSYSEDRKFSRVKLKVGNTRMKSFFQVEDGSVHSQVVDQREVMEFPLDIHGDNPIYIAPIFSEDKIVGFINVERLSFNAKERYSFEMFKIISHWLNRSLVKAFEMHEKILLENTYPNTRILKMDYFNKYLKEEQRRKKLFNMDFIAFEGKIENMGIEKIEKAITGKIRDEDLVSVEGDIIRFIFPATEKESKSLLLNKLANVFEGIDFYEI